MKRILLVTTLCLLASFSFAQKRAVRDAKSAMGSNIDEARGLIKPALTDPETGNDQETWKLAGDIEYKQFDDQLTVEMSKEFTGKAANEELMYNGLYNTYDFYVKADELGQQPDEKGKIKNKVRKDIISKFRFSHQYYINGGLFYNERKDFKKAADFFVKYWDMPLLSMFEGEKEPLINLQDTTYQGMKYYACIMAVQTQDHPRAIQLLNRLISEPYVQNNTYKPSDPYELLASEYQATEDSLNYANTLARAAQAFPSNIYFTTNLINEYIKGGRPADAIKYLDQVLATNPDDKCSLLSVKGSLYAEQKDYKNAEPAYAAAIAADANCERALEGIGVLYVLQAQDLKEVAGQTTNRREQTELDEKTKDLYLKSLPNLEKFLQLLRVRNAETIELRPALVKLQNVYYNLSLLQVDKSKELEAIDKELGVSSTQ
jgi:tetratricopeptide (TPR) repeat protein